MGNGGLRVELTTAPGTTSVCARVVVRSTSEVQRTEPLKLGKARPIVVGVAQGSSPARVTVQALGYSDVGCTKATEPAEQSEAVSTTYADPVPVVQLVLAFWQGPVTGTMKMRCSGGCGDGAIDPVPATPL